jgi:PAS domain S-box-containing protein
MLKVKRSWLPRYGVAVLTVTLALLLKLLLIPLIEVESPFLLFFAAVLVSAWYGGRGPGLLAIALAALISGYFFLSPTYSLFGHSFGQAVRLGLFVVEGVLITLVISALHTAKRRAEVSSLEAQRHLKALQQSEARFGSIAQSSLIGIFFTNLSGNITEANDTFLQILGYTQADLLAGSLHWSDMTPPEYLPQDKRAIAELRESGICTPFEKEYIRKDGSRVPVLLGATFLEGSQHDCVCFALDITERKQAEEALRESEARFRVMADTAPVLIWMSDLDKLCNYFNQPWLDFTGRALEQEFGSGWIQGIYSEDLQQFWQTYITAFDARQAFRTEYRLRRLDGEYRWVLDTGIPRFTSDGRFVGYIGSAIDITERKQAESALLERARLAALTADIGIALNQSDTLQDILQQCTEALVRHLDAAFARVWTLNVESNMLELQASAGIYTHINGSHSRVPVGQFKIGLIAQERQPHLTNAVVGDPRVHNQEWAVREGMVAFAGYPLIVENQLVGVMALFARQALPQATLQEMSSVANAIALGIQRKQAESERDQLLVHEQTARAEAEAANRMKDEFLATLSHELRTPLNAMLGWTQLLRTRKFDEATHARALETVDRNTRSLANLIEDVLDVSRIIRGQLRLNVRPVQLVSVIEAAIDTVRPAAEAKAIRVRSVLDPLVGPVSGDSDRLQQIVWNLLSNAVKFTPKGGRVQVLLERVDSHVELTASDTGQGISAEFLPYVFDRFRQADSSTTRSYSGLGLGLAIVRHLVELHGGTVHAESQGEGQGATFIVKLPLMPVCLKATDPERVHPTVGNGVPFENPPTLNGLRVLVVDDEADTREFLTAVLEECGADVTAIASAKEALEVITRLGPDVLISDIGMPGEDGYALIRKVRSLESGRGKRIPAVALTAYAREEDRTQALLTGFQLHMSKPVSPAELAAVVANLAGRAGKS